MLRCHYECRDRTECVFGPKDVVEILEETNPGKHVSVLHGDMERVGVVDRYSWSCRCGAASERADMTIREAQADFAKHGADEVVWPKGVVTEIGRNLDVKLAVIVPSTFTRMSIFRRDDAEVHWLSCNVCEQSSPKVSFLPDEEITDAASEPICRWRAEHKCPGKKTEVPHVEPVS